MSTGSSHTRSSNLQLSEFQQDFIRHGGGFQPAPPPIAKVQLANLPSPDTRCVEQDDGKPVEQIAQ